MTTISIIDYSDKSFAVVGDTRPIKDKLKELGGRFNARLSCGVGWIFPKSKQSNVEAFINGVEIVTTKTITAPKAVEGEQFKNWLEEYAETTTDRAYYLKYYVGAVKLGDKYFLLEKPDIDNRFCFHDEGEQYKQYKELRADDKKLEAYFVKENCSKFNWFINSITEHQRAYINDCYSDARCHVIYPNENGAACYRDDECTEMTHEQAMLVVEGCKFAKSMLEKRLRTYLKRFGVSKINMWTYWADR